MSGSSNKEESNPEYIISQSTLTCLTIVEGSGAHDAVIGLAKCNGSIKQQWFFSNGQLQWGGDRSLCLAKKNNNNRLQLVPVDKFSGAWQHDSEDRMCLDSLALDVPWDKPRKQVILYPKHNYFNQKWWKFSQLKSCLDGNALVGEHCLTPSILDICKKEINRATAARRKRRSFLKNCHCQVEKDFVIVSKKGEIENSGGITPEFLISQSTLTCLTILSGNGLDAVIGLAPYSGSLNQQWLVNGGQWRWAGNQAYCLAPNWNTGNLRLAEVESCNISWKFDEHGILETMSQVLDVPWEKPRKQVILYPKHGGGNQKWWKLSDVKNALQISPSKASFPPNVQKMAKEMPDKSLEWECYCLANKELVHDDPEYLISQSTYTCLTVINGSNPQDAVIGLAPYNGSESQQWFNTNGKWHWGANRSYFLAPDWSSYTLRLAGDENEGKDSLVEDKSELLTAGSYALDVPWEGQRDNVILYPKHGEINQKWWKLSNLKSCVGSKLYPFKSQDKKVYKEELARCIVNQLCPLSEDLPHPRAIHHYPGTVPKETPRVNLPCVLNVGYVQQPKNLYMTAPEDWQATNMYVAAGEIFKVILPDTLTEKQISQITVRVGAHCDVLDPSSPNIQNGIFKRLPIMSEEFDLHSGTNNLRSQFGGNLIFTYDSTENFTIKIEVQNIIEALHYISGKTNRSDWMRMKDFKAPFSVLESNKVVLIVPTVEAKEISDPESLLKLYDTVMEKLEDLSGFNKDDPAPQGKQWLVDDVQISAGSAHAGFPAMFDHQYYDLSSHNTPQDWVVWHELGHNYQQGNYWSYAYGSESTVNLFSLYIQEIMKSDDRLKKENNYTKAAKKVDQGLTFEKADCWEKLVFLMEIKHAFPNPGWEMFRQVNRTTRALTEEDTRKLKSSRQNQYDFVYKILSQCVGEDLIPHYNRWKLPISEEAKNEIEALGLPKSRQNLTVKI